MLDKIPRIYPITDRSISGLSHAEQVGRFAEGGATMVQLRDKGASGHDLYYWAGQAMDVARAKGIRLIINDRVDIALAIGAHGVHLGQDDLPPAEARLILGEKAIIGFSTHSIAQASAAAEMPVDYIAVGPIFPTSTKQDRDAVVGTTGLLQIRNALPSAVLIGIGGIDAGNIKNVFEAGADSAAVISYLLAAPDEISKRFRRLL